MGHRCCNKQKVKRGLWSPEEDERLVKHITSNGHGSWSSVPKLAGLQRCGKSCRLRWINYLRPDLKRGTFTAEEEQIIIDVHRILGNRWAQIAKHLPGRTDNEVKNFWNSCIKKKLISQGLDPKTHNLLSPHQRAALALEINKLNTTTTTDTTNHYNTSKPAVIFPTSNFSSSSPNSQYSEDLDQQPQVPISSLLTHTDTANLTSSSLDIPSPALAWNVDDDNNNNNNDSVLPIAGINNIMNLPTCVSSHFPSGPSLNLLEDSYNSVTHHAESLFWEANNCGTLAVDHQAFEAPKSMEVMEKEKVVDHVDNIHGDCEMVPIDEFGQDQQEDFDLAVVDPSLVYGAMYGDFVPMDDFGWNF